MTDIMQVTDPGCCGMRRVDEDGCCVACGRDFFDPETGAEVGDGTRVPNARLTDASFDMLEALEAVCESGASMDINVVEQVWAAIAKAKGKADKFPLRECASPVCSTMVCSDCGECPNRCGFDEDEPSPHDECAIAKARGE